MRRCAILVYKHRPRSISTDPEKYIRRNKMKNTKKLLSLLLVVAMIFSLAVPVFAEGETETPATLASWVGGTSLKNNGDADVLSDVELTVGAVSSGANLKITRLRPRPSATCPQPRGMARTTMQPALSMHMLLSSSAPRATRISA